MRFTWDAGKADFNFRKHGISFHEAATAFRDPLSAIRFLLGATILIIPSARIVS
ncbi:MAG: Ribonuclease toxin, BrnT, of type II toxin-antitoxin system [Candidatus Kentron sp. G]|nr:MAG: Ribonuclease toxin, BrnT, of type II toxin-antitoxin system [Candidatus Kentron sp. G]VFN06421.1 MAG: Ribonuclease toxin, BrnT, of type II toxin-antitoxin system [Candidatus Kentron sp. G]VFN06740.1 MAG: Ribonuclease toxin, BrnT, of type II toxin-antitoxin system [Candidatus Kentron sp. G]